MSNIQSYRNSRIFAIQAFYNYLISEEDNSDVNYIINSLKMAFAEINEVNLQTELSENLIIELFSGVVKNQIDLEKEICLHLSKNWRFERLDLLMQTLLKVAIFELMQNKIDNAIVLDEYTTIAGGFFDEKETGFANGILSNIAKKLNSND